MFPPTNTVFYEWWRGVKTKIQRVVMSPCAERLGWIRELHKDKQATITRRSPPSSAGRFSGVAASSPKTLEGHVADHHSFNKKTPAM